jgi:hypothetical protein
MRARCGKRKEKGGATSAMEEKGGFGRREGCMVPLLEETLSSHFNLIKGENVDADTNISNISIYTTQLSLLSIYIRAVIAFIKYGYDPLSCSNDHFVFYIYIYIYMQAYIIKISLVTQFIIISHRASLFHRVIEICIIQRKKM